MNFQDIVLKILGYRSLSEKYPIIGRIWTAIVFLIMLSPLSLGIIRFIILKENIMIAFILFYLVGPIQYILGVRYMNTHHLQSVLVDYRILGYKISPVHWLVASIFVIATLGIITSVLILVFTQRVPLEFDMLLDMTWLGTDSYRAVYTWFIINWIFSSYVLSVNTSIFAYVFHKHLEDIRYLQDDLESVMIWKMDQTSFTELSRKIIGLRYVISQSVDKLESLYTSTTLLGAIALGSIIEFKQLNAYLIYYIVVFFLSQFSFLYFIYYISKNREDILKIIKSPTVMFKYLTNVKSMKNIDVLRKEMNELQKIDPTKAHTLNKFKIAAYSNITYDHMVDVEKGREEGSYSSTDGDVEGEILTLGYKNNAAIDWMILQGILQEKWANFNLMGVSFDGSDVITKAAGITSLIIIASSFINSLNII